MRYNGLVGLMSVLNLVVRINPISDLALTARPHGSYTLKISMSKIEKEGSTEVQRMSSPELIRVKF